MTSDSPIKRPRLARAARYRWDAVRQEHQLVFPEGVLVLNASGAAIVQLCDGRSTDELIGALQEQITDYNLSEDVQEFLTRLAKKGLLCDADA